LHLFLINFHHTSIAITLPLIANYKTIGKRSHLKLVANTRHWPTLGHYVFEFMKYFKHLFFAHRLRVFFFYPADLFCHPMVHILRRLLIYVSIRILKGVLV